MHCQLDLDTREKFYWWRTRAELAPKSGKFYKFELSTINH